MGSRRSSRSSNTLPSSPSRARARKASTASRRRAAKQAFKTQFKAHQTPPLKKVKAAVRRAFPDHPASPARGHLGPTARRYRSHPRPNGSRQSSPGRQNVLKTLRHPGSSRLPLPTGHRRALCFQLLHQEIHRRHRRQAGRSLPSVARRRIEEEQDEARGGRRLQRQCATEKDAEGVTAEAPATAPQTEAQPTEKTPPRADARTSKAATTKAAPPAPEKAPKTRKTTAKNLHHRQEHRLRGATTLRRHATLQLHRHRPHIAILLPPYPRGHGPFLVGTKR
mmetsp:Transcript_76231/g.166402  ORF Transcript_76231/g.166402 Transcript_76231/m.166402 type:complete len:280 (-) Transcript_76231:2306-3145(-)